MARLLLKFGATASQADSNGCTAFQRFIEAADADVTDVLMKEDKTGIKNAINHLVVQGYSWRPETIAPLHTAIDRGDSILVLQLLNNGADAQIDFDTWLKAAKISRSSSMLGSLEDNKKKYQESLEQPIMAALRSGNAELVLELLKRGADPNAMSKDTAELMSNEYRRRYTKGKLALDVVRKFISQFKNLEKSKAKIMARAKEPLGMDAYLAKFEKGSYQHWLVAEEIESKKASHKTNLEYHEKTAPKWKQDAKEYQEAVDELIARFTDVEKALLSHGAKTFEEVYPDIKTGEDDSYSRRYGSDSNEKEAKQYSYTFSFEDERDITEKRQEGYIML